MIYRVESASDAENTPEAKEKALRNISLRFAKQVAETLGTDKAKLVINSLSESLGREWSNNIILDIVSAPVDLRETNEERLTIPVQGRQVAKINLIKAFRAMSGQGLKETKDVVEDIMFKVEAWEARQMGVLFNASYNHAPFVRVVVNQSDPYQTQGLSDWVMHGGIRL